MELPVQFGKYSLEKYLGGGMSQVYKATDTVLGRTVAVKILTDEGCRDEDAKKRFLLEARMSGNIVHDNIIRIHDYGEISGRPYIVMEFLVGQDLRTAIEKNATGDLAGKLNIALQAARALGHVHTLNVIHRDIKPENLHIDTTGRVRLMDFGIAKAANLSLTKTGFAIGTPYYMAPEQVLGKPVTPAADIYAFGLVLFEMLTGQKPVAGQTIEVLFYQILHQPLDLEPLQKLGVPEDLIGLIARCAAKKPEERPANFGAVIAELEGMLQRYGGYAAGNATQSWQQPQGATQSWQATQGIQGTQAAKQPTSMQPNAQASAGASSTGTEAVPAKKNMLPYLAVGGALVIAVALAIIFIPGKTPETKTGGDIKKDVPPVFTLPKTYADPKTGADMILIDEGYFLFDKDNRKEFIDAYYIDKTEVTKAAWTKYAQEKGLPPPEGEPEEPMTHVTIGQAREFAEWAGKALPNARQWEKAARGTDGRKYPWGSSDDLTMANLKGNPKLPPDKVQPAGSDFGVSPFGLLNVAGNVWEYVDERRAPTQAWFASARKAGLRVTPGDEFFTARGGSYRTGLDGATLWEFAPVLDDFGGSEWGFRCVKAAKLVENELKGK